MKGITIIDMAGREVTVPMNVQRVMCLGSSALRIVVVARVLYLDNYGNFSNERGLPPLALHQIPWPIGSDIDRGHEARLTRD